MFIRICNAGVSPARAVILLLFLLASIAHASADLELKSLQAFPDANTKAIQIKFIWTNRGPDSATQPGVNVYVYNNQRLVISETLALQPLAAAESREESIKVSYPSEVVTLVKAEIFDAQQPDLQPSTNSTQVNIRLPDLKKADLQILSATVEGEQPLKGKSAMIHLQVRNNGPELSRNSKLVAQLMLYGSAVGKNEKRLQRVGVGEDLDLKWPFPLPENIPATEGVLQVDWIHGNPDVQDPDTPNSSVKLPVGLVIRMPDLAPKDVALDKRGVLSFSIVNKGNAICRDTITAMYINGALIQRFNTRQLRGGENQRLQYTAPAKIASGSQISVVADFNADVEEISEENNRLNYIVK
jgi:hypothetical protein